MDVFIFILILQYFIVIMGKCRNLCDVAWPIKYTRGLFWCALADFKESNNV